MPPLSPRAQEILDAIEREVTGSSAAPARSAAAPAFASEPPAAPKASRQEPTEAAPLADAPRLLGLVDALIAQSEQARLRLAALTDGMRAAEAALDPPAAPATPGATVDRRRRGAAPGRPAATEIIDLHHHLLPGVDDGPRTLDDALELARAAVAGGTTTVVATPHVSWDYPDITAALVREHVARLERALEAAGIALRVLPGAEVAVTRAVDLPDDELVALRLGGGPYLLVECPFSPTATGMEAALDSLLRRGHRLLLAHPERCPAFQHEDDVLARLVARGVLAQVTAGSLTGHFGRTVRDVAHEMVQDGHVHVVASDAHSVARRPPSMLAELEAEGYGGQAPWLVAEMPRAILDGTALPPMPTFPPRPRSAVKRLLGR